MRTILTFLCFVLSGITAVASGRRVLLEVHDASAAEISVIKEVLKKAARGAVLAEHTAATSDAEALASYSNAEFGISIAARRLVGRVEILLEWSQPDSSVSAEQLFHALEVYLSNRFKELFQSRLERKPSGKEPNQPLEPMR